MFTRSVIAAASGTRRKITTTASKSIQKKKKVVITSRAFESTYDLITSTGGLSITKNESTEPWSREELLSHAHDAHAILAFMTDSCDQKLLDACPNLELIACALKGFDNFDTKLCAERGVAVTAVPDLLTGPTAEMAILLALGLGRRIREADEAVRSGLFRGWRPTLYGMGLEGATIGVYGAGAVGCAVMERIRGFKPNRLLYVDPIPLDGVADDDDDDGCVGRMERVDGIGELMQHSDVLFVCTPLNPSTHKSINENTLRQAKPNMRLVNISRGSCVDESAVADALDEGLISGYAADVFEFEDWILADRPDCIDRRLLDHPCTLFSPHLGSAVGGVRCDIERAAAEEIVRWWKGEAYRYRVN